VFTAEDAVAAAADGLACILVRPFTEADDVAGFHAARGILTSEGGKASHAALVARGMGRPAVTGAAALDVDLLDPPLHEFLPDRFELVERLTEARLGETAEVAELEHVLEQMRARSRRRPTSSRSGPTTSPRPRSASRATTSRRGSFRSTPTSASSSARRSARSTWTASAS
jgi:hypothetical protein